MSEPLSLEAQNKALDLLAVWLGTRMGYEGPAPTGSDAAYRALGPQLVSDWDWPGKPTPTILLEGGPEEWAVYASHDEELRDQLRAVGVWTEPYAGYALCLYPVPS
jgi:hypothetical protein